ncbi:MAG: rubredoxin [Tistrella sp.]|jgi:rubredoxin|uniref:Rubredoxin n=1 Tax=Tistrella mobilis TaxID=171437 RepID=A0A161PQZ9_9PROT|nr:MULTISPECIES: rubredoxin [Tistrella]KYO53461.1 rubredoxin reductase [Tistrella mobilis]MAD38766.1 rubredoxin [Tistrella sp.]MBA78651.1 rubredoxin [Tistrella sp.]HAE48695.1 rubredoxin [Tistrella mobilis]
MTAKIEAEAGATAGKAWKCLLCTYVYDEATGSPAHGIPPGTRLEDLDEDWSCPDCGAGREDFEPLDA